MSIERQLDDELKAAMRARDQGKIACIRGVRAKVKEATTAKGFSGPTDDALFQRVIAAYVKQLRNALPELEAAGERGVELRAGYEAEVAYLDAYLPAKLDEASTRKLVDEAIATLGVSDPKRAGQVMGAIMKQHRDSVDPAIVKRLVDEKLGA